MFTGLIEELGELCRRERRGELQRLEIGARAVLDGTRVGDSLNLNGVCQTAVEVGPGSFWVESVEETLRRTTLGELRPGDPVNLERALQPQGRLGGHLVLGHVDGVGTVRRFAPAGAEWRLEVQPPAGLERYIAARGSIAIDGISLTVAAVEPGAFTVSIIPHTLRHTNLTGRRAGDHVNLEVDVLTRYLERLLEPARRAGAAPVPERPALTLERLREMGY